MNRTTQASTSTSDTTRETTQSTKIRIQETTDLSIFKSLPHNRPVVQSHVIRLAGSMSTRPHLRPARPVLVNEKYQVIDGQHRLKASELNGQSVYFMVVEELTIDDARLLNALQRTWSLLDYAYSYASSKIPAYVQFVKNYEARELPPSVILEFMTNSGSKARSNFRLGIIEPIAQDTVAVNLNKLEQILEEFPKASTPYIVAAAFSKILRTEGYDHNRMIQKIKRSSPQAQPSRVDYVRELERIYNADVPFNGPSYVRFF